MTGRNVERRRRWIWPLAVGILLAGATVALYCCLRESLRPAGVALGIVAVDSVLLALILLGFILERRKAG